MCCLFYSNGVDKSEPILMECHNCNKLKCVCVCDLQRPLVTPTKTLRCKVTSPLTISTQPPAHSHSIELSPCPPPARFLSEQTNCFFHPLQTPPLSPFYTTIQRITVDVLETPTNQNTPLPKWTWKSSVSHKTPGGERASSLRPSLSWRSFLLSLPAAGARSTLSVWTVIKST